MAKRAKAKKATYKKAVKKAVTKPRKQFKVFDHDEPIIVDNGPVLISNRNAVVTLKGGGKKAERRFTKFAKLIVEKTDHAGSTLPTETDDLAEDGSITFHLFDSSTGKSDTIKIKRIGLFKDGVRLESSFDLFEFEDNLKKKLKMKGNSQARLTAVSADGKAGAILKIFVDANNDFLFTAVTVTVEAAKH
jgi:hypothetical protein